MSVIMKILNRLVVHPMFELIYMFLFLSFFFPMEFMMVGLFFPYLDEESNQRRIRAHTSSPEYGIL